MVNYYNPQELIKVLYSVSNLEQLLETSGKTHEYLYWLINGETAYRKWTQVDRETIKRRFKELCEASNTAMAPKSVIIRRNEYRLRKKAEAEAKLNTYSKEVKYDSSEDEEFEDRATTEIIRDSMGKIIEYKFTILRRDNEPFTGTLTLDQMQNLYFLYSNQGRNLPTNKVLESFPQYTINELKKIIRAFNITKCSEPFAPHFIETHTDEELRDFRIRYKGERSANAAMRDESKGLQDYIKQQAQKLKDLKTQLNDYDSMFKSLNLPTFDFKPTSSNKRDRSLILYPSDMHIGCYIQKRSTFYHPYDLPEIKRRIDKMLEPFMGQSYDEIIIANLGDTIDGFNAMTSRGTILPQIADGNKEIFQWFMEAMMYMMSKINSGMKYNLLRYYSVGDSNHGGSIEYVCQKALEYALLNAFKEDVIVEIFDENYGMFNVYDQNYLITHGKDSNEMIKNLPLTINRNPEVELRMNQLLDRKFKVQYAHIIKGDLHQSATTYGDRFRYRSVGCMLGSSEWTAANFGDNDAIVDYDIVYSDGTILEGRIKVN